MFLFDIPITQWTLPILVVLPLAVILVIFYQWKNGGALERQLESVEADREWQTGEKDRLKIKNYELSKALRRATEDALKLKLSEKLGELQRVAGTRDHERVGFQHQTLVDAEKQLRTCSDPLEQFYLVYPELRPEVPTKDEKS